MGNREFDDVLIVFKTDAGFPVCIPLCITAERVELQTIQVDVNLDGLQFDALGGDAQWNADWKACVSLEDNQYVVEFAIPHAALGADSPKPGEKWALNILRGRGTREPKWERYAQWVMTYADFNSSTHLGTLQF